MIDKRKNVVFDDTPRQCPECGGKYVFQGAGRYVCENCGHETYDDFGKIKAFIDEQLLTSFSDIALYIILLIPEKFNTFSG